MIIAEASSQRSFAIIEREILEFASLLHDIGQFISFRKHHKNSRYIIKQTNPRGFTDEEVLLIKHLVRY